MQRGLGRLLRVEQHPVRLLLGRERHRAARRARTPRRARGASSRRRGGRGLGGGLGRRSRAGDEDPQVGQQAARAGEEGRFDRDTGGGGGGEAPSCWARRGERFGERRGGERRGGQDPPWSRHLAARVERGPEDEDSERARAGGSFPEPCARRCVLRSPLVDSRCIAAGEG